LGLKISRPCQAPKPGLGRPKLVTGIFDPMMHYIKIWTGFLMCVSSFHLPPTFDSAVIFHYTFFLLYLQFRISAAASLSGIKVPDSAYFFLYHSDVRRTHCTKGTWVGFWTIPWVITSWM
jgi:hypothetical protein